MREFRLETVGPIGDCAVLQVTGEVDVYTATQSRTGGTQPKAKPEACTHGADGTACPDSGGG